MLEFELVLPCYNEARSIENLVRRAAQSAEIAGYNHERFQLVLVENGSKDDSNSRMDELKATELGKWFRKVKVEINEGYGFGLHKGLSNTSAPIVGWSHADQQCDPKDAFIALEKLKRLGQTKFLVKGVRSGRNWKDKFVSRVFEFCAWVVLGSRMYEINAQPKVFSRDLLQSLPNPPKTFAFDLYVLYQAKKSGKRVEVVEVQFPPRVHGLSNWASSFFGRYKTILGMVQYMFELARKEGRL